MQRRKTVLWTIIGMISCTFWGISGLAAKALFNLDSSINAIWLSQVRMICTGMVLLAFSAIIKQRPLAIWREPKAPSILILYAVLGIVPVQFC